MRAIDITKNEVKSQGVAYYRIPGDFREFLFKCRQKHSIVGFEWNGGEGDDNGWNFGVILSDKKNET